MSRSAVGTIGCAALVAVAAWSVSASAQDTARGLRGLARVALDVSLAPDVVDLRDEVEQRMEQSLREQQPAPLLVRDGADKLRLVVTVQARSASELRGFWLPLSGTYAIGYVRLEVERGVALPGPTPTAAVVPAVVWQADRLVSSPWRQAETEIVGAVERLLAVFLEDYRRTRGR
jgi:hypothetical protein